MEPENETNLLQGLTIGHVMMYEIAASWWAPQLGIGWMQNLAARYYAWKVKKKWRRFIVVCERAERTRRMEDDDA